MFMDHANILLPRRKHESGIKIINIVLSFLIAFFILGSICQAKEVPKEEVCFEFLPKGDSYVDETGEIWAKAYELFVVIRGKITCDFDGKVQLWHKESGQCTPLQLSVSENEMVAVVHTSVSRNGCYKMISSEEYAGEETEYGQAIIQKIDREGPIITCEMKPKVWTEGVLKIHIEAHDEGCGLAEKAFSFDGGNTFGNSCDYRMKRSGKLAVVVKDALGNETRQELEVSKQPIVIVSENNIINSDRTKLIDIENKGQQDLQVEDVVEPAATNHALFEETMAVVKQEDDARKRQDEDLPVRQEMKTNTSLNTPVTKTEKHELDDSDKPIQNEATKTEINMRIKEHALLNEAVIQKVIHVGLPILSGVLLLLGNLLLLKRFHSAEVFAKDEKEVLEKLGEGHLFKKEGKQVLVIQDEVFSKQNYHAYEIRVSYLYAKRFEEMPLYVSYLGKTAELIIEPRMPFIV